MSFNVQGFSSTKAELLSDLKLDVLCIQETHRCDENPPLIPGMHLIIAHGSAKHGSAIFAKDKSIIMESKNHYENGMEILRIETTNLSITSVYKPPPTPFHWPHNFPQTSKATVVIGDFNSHSTSWGYEETNEDGLAVEEWATNLNLTILHNAKDQPSFNSARHKKGYNPDLTFASSRHTDNFEKTIGDPIPKSQHRPIVLNVRPVIKPLESKYIPRFNFRKANWEGFTTDLNIEIASINPDPKNYEQFKTAVWKTAKKHIPRGCRKSYIPCLSNEGKQLYEDYKKAYETDPFAETTIQLGESLMSSVSNGKAEKWQDLITNTDMTHNSKKAWSTIKKLNCEKKAPSRVAAVTPNEVANQLI